MLYRGFLEYLTIENLCVLSSASKASGKIVDIECERRRTATASRHFLTLRGDWKTKFKQMQETCNSYADFDG